MKPPQNHRQGKKERGELKWVDLRSHASPEPRSDLQSQGLSRPIRKKHNPRGSTTMMGWRIDPVGLYKGEDGNAPAKENAAGDLLLEMRTGESLLMRCTRMVCPLALPVLILVNGCQNPESIEELKRILRLHLKTTEE
jgi:hypothetical protein